MNHQNEFVVAAALLVVGGGALLAVFIDELKWRLAERRRRLRRARVGDVDLTGAKPS